MNNTRVLHSVEFYQAKAQVLIDALPYLRDFNQKTMVVCYSCNDILSGEEEEALMLDLTTLHSVGIRIVLVHDTRMGMDKFRENKRLAKLVELCGVKAIGVCGIDEQTLHITLDNGYIPVITPNDIDTEHLPLNPVDTALEIAGLLKAEKLIYLSRFDGVTDENGVLQNSMTVGELMTVMRYREEDPRMRKMMNNAVDALKEGVSRVHILNGKIPHSLLVELFSIDGAGTMIMNDRSGLYSHEQTFYAAQQKANAGNEA